MKPNEWPRIAAHYRSVMPEIMAKPANRWAIDPYAWVPEGVYMTPIEEALWTDIRAEGAVFYPQVPVGRFFVDFGNPVAMVAIECDGAAWHMDKERDDERQAAIEDMGWMVYRISGSDCKRPDKYEFDSNGVERMTVGPGRELVRLICNCHGISQLRIRETA